MQERDTSSNTTGPTATDTDVSDKSESEGDSGFGDSSEPKKPDTTGRSGSQDGISEKAVESASARKGASRATSEVKPADERIESCRRSEEGCDNARRYAKPEELEKLSDDDLVKKLIEQAKRQSSQIGSQKFEKGRWWKQSWGDDFNGPDPGEDDYCYSDVEPRCMDNWWHSEKCPDDPDIQSNLDNLDKCTWSIYDYYNYMPDDANAFDPSAVEVKGGELILTSRAVKKDSYDCGREKQNTSYGQKTTDCPYVTGGVETRAFPGKGREAKGYIQKYGRFEVRAKLPSGDGAWPAHWMLSHDGGWPYKGEIDIMEMWDGQWPKNYQAGLYGGNPAIDGSGTNPGSSHNSIDLKRNVTRQPFNNWGDTFVEDYNTYAVEWMPNKMAFYFNNIHLGTLHNGQGTYDDDMEMCHRLDMPDTPFYTILNNSVTLEEYDDDFETRKHRIDHVRSYRRCKTDSDFCPWGGTFNGRACAVIAEPDGVDTILEGGKLTYSTSNRECSHGGTFKNGRCLLYEVPANSNPRMQGNILYTDSACVESTLSRFCSNPCQGRGKFTGYRCKLGDAPDDLKPYVEDGQFRYENTGFVGIGSDTDASDCRAEDKYLGESEGCYFADVPDGRNAVAHNGTFYLEPTCNTTSSLMNCPKPCKWGGDFDGQNCYIRGVPEGTEPFIYNRGFYYKAKSANPEKACPSGGTYDGSNCYLGYKAPEGSEPFIYGDSFYIKPRCDHSPDWQNLHTKIFKTDKSDMCSREDFPESRITYRSHVRFNGWTDWKKEGQTVGEPASGWTDRLQGLQLHLPYNRISDAELKEKLEKVDIKCRAYSFSEDWMDWVKGSDICGKTGRRLEAIRLKLESNDGSSVSGNVYYRAYVKDSGWTEWQTNGEAAGTTDNNDRLEAIEIELRGF